MKSPEELPLEVVIVTYQSAGTITACLRSVLESTSAESTRITVVDSASSDHSLARVRAVAPSARVVGLDENRGFAHAVNQGLLNVGRGHVLLLNPDAVLAPETIAALRGRLEADLSLGAIAPRIVNEEGRVQPAGQLLPNFGSELARTFERLARPLGMRRTDELGPGESPDWLSGACLLIRREALDDVGLLDEGFFLYFEETDWCRRALRAGFRFAVEDSSTVVHIGGASVAAAADPSIRRADDHFERSRRRYFRKHHGPVTRASVELLHRVRQRLDRAIRRTR